MRYFLRNHGTNVKIHHFSIRLCVLSRTTVQQKCGVLLLHSWFYTRRGFDLKPRIHERAEWFANQMRVCVDGTANLCCAIHKRFAYHSPRTKICRFFVRTQRELDESGVLSMHKVSFARFKFAEN